MRAWPRAPSRALWQLVLQGELQRGGQQVEQQVPRPHAAPALTKLQRSMARCARSREREAKGGEQSGACAHANTGQREEGVRWLVRVLASRFACVRVLKCVSRGGNERARGSGREGGAQSKSSAASSTGDLRLTPSSGQASTQPATAADHL
eukprot:794498-Pleurochrysis_carterae.AAC.1